MSLPRVIYNLAVLAFTGLIIWMTGSLWGLLGLLALQDEEDKP